MATPNDHAEDFEEGEEDFPESGQEGQEAGPEYPGVEAAIKADEAAKAAGPAPAAAPAADASKGKPVAQRSGPVVAEAVRLREARKQLDSDRASFQKELEGLAPLREVSALLQKGDSVGALRKLAGDDGRFFSLISEAATAAAEVKEKNPQAAATALPQAVQAELAELRAAAATVKTLQKELEQLQKERAEGLKAYQQEHFTKLAEQVWTEGWSDVQAKAAELPHVVRADDEQAQTEALDLVEQEYLRLAQQERGKTGKAVPMARARALVMEAATTINGRLARLLPASARPGKVSSGPASTAASPRAPTPKPSTSATGQGNTRPRTLPPKGQMPAPARVDQSNLSEQERRDKAAEALASQFPELR